MNQYKLEILPSGIVRVFDRQTRWDFLYDLAGKRIGGGGCASADVDELVRQRLATAAAASAVTIHHEALDVLGWPAPFCRHLFIDVEPLGNGAAGWALAVRGEDKRVIGRTNKPWECAFVFNDPAGDYRRFVLATADAREPLEVLGDGLIRFYRATGPLGQRTAEATGNPLLPVLLGRFGAEDFIEGNPSQRRCGPFATLGPVHLRTSAATSAATTEATA